MNRNAIKPSSIKLDIHQKSVSGLCDRKVIREAEKCVRKKFRKMCQDLIRTAYRVVCLEEVEEKSVREVQ